MSWHIFAVALYAISMTVPFVGAWYAVKKTNLPLGPIELFLVLFLLPVTFVGAVFFWGLPNSRAHNGEVWGYVEAAFGNLLGLIVTTEIWWAPLLIKNGSAVFSTLPAVIKYRELQALRHKEQPPVKPVLSSFPSPTEYVDDFMRRAAHNFFNQKMLPPAGALHAALSAVVKELYSFDFAHPETGKPNATIQAAIEEKTATRRELLDIFDAALRSALLPFALNFPQETSALKVPVTSVITLAPIIVGMFDAFPASNYGLFAGINATILANRWRVSRSQLSERALADKKRIQPDTFEGTPAELAYAYMRDTPLLSLFQLEVPLATESKRFEHQFVVAPSGSGKTQLLQAQIAEDLKKVERGEASLIIMDSQGVNEGREGKERTLVENVIGLKLFAKGQPLEGKLVYIRPHKDLSLNIFDMGQTDPNLSERDQEVLRASSREMIAMCLSGATEIQTRMIEWCIKLAMLMPNPTIGTIRRILNTKPEDFARTYKHVLDDEKTDQRTREYFLETFSKRERGVTKDAILLRIDSMMSSDTFAAMFQHPQNDFNMLNELEAGKVIVINTDKELLKGGCEPFGRFFIAMLLHASQQRKTGKPVYCYIDECQDYVANDENISTILSQARKQKVGLTLATVGLEKFSSQKVEAALLNVSTLFAGRNKTDASTLARLMQTDAETLAKQQTGTFAVYIQDKTPNGAIQVKVRGGIMEDMERMTAEEFVEVHALKKKQPPATAPSASLPPEDDEPDVL